MSKITIDTEDSQQVQALADALNAAMCTQGHEWDESYRREVSAHMRAALEKFAHAIGEPTDYEADPRDCCDRCGGATRHRPPCAALSPASTPESEGGR